MTNYDRAIHGAAWALILAGVAVILALCVHPMTAGAAAIRPAAPRPCTFDGGGTIASGDAARTDTGEWVCADGQLVHVAGYAAPRWVDLRSVPAAVRRQLGIRGQAVMLVTPAETLIVTRAGQVYPS